MGKGNGYGYGHGLCHIVDASTWTGCTCDERRVLGLLRPFGVYFKFLVVSC